MKSNNRKKARFIIVGFIIIATVTFAVNSSASKDLDGACGGCHPGGYTIAVNSTTIAGEASSNQSLEVTGTGSGVVIDVYAGAKDNDVFTISPSNIIADNDGTYDLDPAVDSIRVEITVTLPAETGVYTLRVIARAAALSGQATPVAESDIEVSVGDVAALVPSILDLFLDHSGLLIGAHIVLLACVGGIVYSINVKKRNDSKDHGVFIGLALLLASLNMLLAMNDTLDFFLVNFELTSNQAIDQLVHILLGSIALVAGIVVVAGTYTKVSAEKLKIPVIITLAGFTFNYFYGIIMLTPLGG